MGAPVAPRAVLYTWGDPSYGVTPPNPPRAGRQQG